MANEPPRAGPVIDQVSKVTAKITGQASGLFIQRKPIRPDQVDMWIRQLEELVALLKSLRGK